MTTAFRNSLLIGALACLPACGGGGGGGGGDSTRPAIIGAAFVGAGPGPTAGETLILFLSEDVALAAGADLDDLIGVVHVKAVHLVPVAGRSTTRVVDLMAPILAVPEARDLDELLVDLREGGQQLAAVIDEHGGTAGIITLEDVLEEILY